MKKCPQCERMLPDDAKQCTYCGEELDDVVSQPASQEPQEDVEIQEEPLEDVQEVAQEEAPKQPQPARKTVSAAAPKQERPATNTNMLYGIIAFLAALLVCGGVFWFMSQDKGSPTEEPVTGQVIEAPAEEAVTEEAMTEEPLPNDGYSQANPVNDDGPVADEDDTGCTLGKVMVTGENVRLRTSPEINNHNILKDKKGKNLHPKKGQVLECIDAEGDFYFVYFNDMPCYISKQFTKFVE